jgi:carboxylesterase type B
MGHNDFEQPICLDHPDMNYTAAVKVLTQSFEQKWIPLIIDYYHLESCSSDRTANASRCCDIIRMILMDKTFDCDIRRIFDSFYQRYGPEYEENKLFSYHLNCYPTCPVAYPYHACEHSAEIPFVFGTVSDVYSRSVVNCTWDNQTREFSDGIISHWISVARTGRPLSSWPSYDPLAPKHFHITPDQGFLPETWKRNCSFFNAMEAQGVKETFGNKLLN